MVVWRVSRCFRRLNSITTFSRISGTGDHQKKIEPCYYSQAASATSVSDSNSANQVPVIGFNDPKVAHASKTNVDLLRGIVVFGMCSISPLVKYNKQLMELSRKVLGRSMFRLLMRSTIYGHFVAGASREDIEPVVRRLRKFGVKSILDYSVEKDVGDSEAVEEARGGLAEVVQEPVVRPAAATKQYQTSLQFANRSQNVVAARTYFYESEYQCDRNMEVFLQCLDYVSGSTEKEGFAAIKVTALGRPQLLLQMSDFLVQMKRLFNLLLAADDGNLQNQTTQLRVLDVNNFRQRLERLGVKISYDDNLKWFTLLDVSGDGVVDLLDWSHLKSFEHDLAAIFTVRNRETGKLEQLVPTLTPDGLEQMRNMLRRMDTIATYAKSVGVRVMVDAEQSYFQPAIRRLTMEMMRLFNKDGAVMFNTYQCYLKDAYDLLQQDLNHSEVEGFHFGAKLVRGAYIDQERARARALDYEDPICPTYDATTKMYQSCVLGVLNAIKQRPLGQVSVMMATHNEDMVRFVLEKMYEYNVTPEQRLICFGQLLGMCDHVSFTLGQRGYSVYKYVPYGPVEDVLPYLSRRALENGSMLSKAKLERQTMWSELKRRLKQGELFYKP
ncbi:Proline dehydrogenase 1, mitochondrial [Clonorchis sinensis]|uniref:Proline dehydrogenase n=1 Tax=Clonorchis sinensis TaxID=79923 RepID=A0A8T1MSV6_CLOSI|nr:Proline dehydrogenase 1, mitochondrial [Clonorchis sinensis]